MSTKSIILEHAISFTREQNSSTSNMSAIYNESNGQKPRGWVKLTLQEGRAKPPPEYLDQHPKSQIAWIEIMKLPPDLKRAVDSRR